MGLLGFNTKKETAGLISAALAKQNKQKSIIDSLTVESLDRAKANVEEWREALRQWEDAILPDRYEMMQLYREVIQDDSVSTHLTTIIGRITGTAFQIGTKNGEDFTEDETLTDLLRKSWLDDVIRYIIESEMMGFTLVEVTPPTAGIYSADNFVSVPRHLLMPEHGKIRTRAQVNTNYIDYTEPKYAQRLLQLGSKTGKGLFNNLALLYIYKKNALAFWANYQAKFGIPPMVIKTDLTNKVLTDSLTTFAQEMRNNSFTLVNYNDEITALAGVSVDAFQTFKELIDHCDNQISKVLGGQTMTSSDGSSRSQAEVHERTSDDWPQARLRNVERILNDQLLPILERDGMAVAGKVFRFKEIKDVDKIIDRLVKIKQAGFTMDEQQASDLTGYTLTTAVAPAPTIAPVDPSKPDPKKETPPTKAPKSILSAINDLYKDFE